MNQARLLFKAFYLHLFSIVIILAVALHFWPIQSLGLCTVWVIFYPAVLIATLYGGLLCCLLPFYIETANSDLDLLENCELPKLNRQIENQKEDTNG